MKHMGGAERLWFFLVGGLMATGLFFLLGSGPEGQVGRYQISTCLKRDWVYVYVIDTTTGVVKFVDEKNENKPFGEVNSSK
ncbi:MAG: hypothetical protein ACM3KE_06295 [Hyphomicrobiales bacterium]